MENERNGLNSSRFSLIRGICLVHMKITVSATQNSNTKANKFWRRSRTTTTKKNVTNESKERSDWNYTSRRVRTTRNWRRNDLTKNADAVDLLLRSDSIFFFVYDTTIFSQRFGYLWYMWKKWNFIKGLSSRDWAERNIGLFLFLLFLFPNFFRKRNKNWWK